jgi:hypothetical protein
MSATDTGADFPYATYLDIKFDPLKLIDVPYSCGPAPTSGIIRRSAR